MHISCIYQIKIVCSWHFAISMLNCNYYSYSPWSRAFTSKVARTNNFYSIHAQYFVIIFQNYREWNWPLLKCEFIISVFSIIVFYCICVCTFNLVTIWQKHAYLVSCGCKILKNTETGIGLSFLVMIYLQCKIYRCITTKTTLIWSNESDTQKTWYQKVHHKAFNFKINQETRNINTYNLLLYLTSYVQMVKGLFLHILYIRYVYISLVYACVL